MKKLLSVLAFSVLILTCQAKELSLNLKAGQVYQQELKNQMDLQFKIEGNEMLINGNFDLVVEYLIKSAEADAYEIQMSLKNITGNVSSDQFNLSLDTVSSQNNPLSGILNLVVNKPIVYTMSKTGKILDIPDLSSLNMDLNLSGDTTLSKLLEESMNTQSGGMMKSIYPDHEVAVGDSWTISTRNPNTEAEMINTYIWKSSKGGKNIIEMKSENFNLDFSIPIKSENEISIQIQMEGKSGGEFQLNKKTGWIEASESQVEATCKLIFAPNAQMPDGAEIPMNFKVISKLGQVK
jgi:hypothetical protein